jgi:hypothetical protein
MNSEAVSDYTGYRAVAAEGARIAFVTCKRCGATITLEERGLDATEIHDKWHESQREVAPNA